MAYKWGIKKAVIISSVIFGLGHFDVIGAFMFGVVMCLLYIKTKNIWTNIAVHALNNFIATSMQFVGGEEEAAPFQFLNYKRKVIYGSVSVLQSLDYFG